jgi:ribose transport system substrate-binding protein
MPKAPRLRFRKGCGSAASAPWEIHVTLLCKVTPQEETLLILPAHLLLYLCWEEERALVIEGAALCFWRNKNLGVAAPCPHGRTITMQYAVKIAAATAMGLLFGSAALTPALADDKPTLAFVANGASDFWKAAEAGMKKAQAELPDYTLEFKYPEQSSVAIQQTLMDNLVTAGVKGIMVSAVDPKATEVLDKIAGQTALFTTDSDAPNSKRIAYIGSSNVLAGGQAAEIAKKAMPDGGKCMGFVGLLDAANYKERAQGFVEGLKGTKITLVDTRGDDIDQTRAKSNVEAALAANPEVTCMVGFYSYNTPRIYEALKDAGKLGKITIVGFDDDPITLGGVKEGTIAGTVVQQPFEWAYQGFKLMAAYLKDNKTPMPARGQLIIPTKVLYAADIDPYAANLKAMAGGN